MKTTTLAPALLRKLNAWWRATKALPYGRIQAFSVETAGTFDRDTELDLWFSGLDRVRLEFQAKVDIGALNRIIAERVL